MSRKPLQVVSYRYEVSPQNAEANAKAVRAVFDQLAAHRSQVGYLTLRSGEHQERFQHLVWGDADQLTSLEAFSEFQRGLAERLVGAVERVESTLLGAHARDISIR